MQSLSEVALEAQPWQRTLQTQDIECSCWSVQHASKDRVRGEQMHPWGSGSSAFPWSVGPRIESPPLKVATGG